MKSKCARLPDNLTITKEDSGYWIVRYMQHAEFGDTIEDAITNLIKKLAIQLEKEKQKNQKQNEKI